MLGRQIKKDQPCCRQSVKVKVDINDRLYSVEEPHYYCSSQDPVYCSSRWFIIIHIQLFFSNITSCGSPVDPPFPNPRNTWSDSCAISVVYHAESYGDGMISRDNGSDSCIPETSHDKSTKAYLDRTQPPYFVAVWTLSAGAKFASS